VIPVRVDKRQLPKIRLAGIADAGYRTDDRVHTHLRRLEGVCIDSPIYFIESRFQRLLLVQLNTWGVAPG
jgi:hypothetical protein